MLAGEEFSDRPRCVDPVLAAFLRSFNDRLSHTERQRLYPYAALAVNTRDSREVTRARLDQCLAFAGHDPRGGRLRRVLMHTRMRVVLGALLGVRRALHLREGAAEYAARIAIASGDPDAGFDLLDRLLSEGRTRRPTAVAQPGAPRPEPVPV